MSPWQETKLGRAVRVHHGFTFKGEYFADSGDLIVLTPGNFIETGGFKPKRGTEKYYSGSFPKKFLLDRGDVVVAMTEQAAGLLGSSATIPAEGTYLHNQRIGLIEVTDPTRIDLRFVYHLMNAPYVRQQLQATATGSKVRHTAPERIHDLSVRLPSLPTQRAIAATLDAVDDLIKNNRQRIELLEGMARVIYREWFVHFRYPGHEAVRLVDSSLGPIPEAWNVATVDDLVGVAKETLDPSLLDPATPAVGLEHIPRRQITLDDWGRAGDLGSRKATFKKGDILFGKIRPYFHKVSVAAIDGICSTDAIVIRPKPVHWGEAVAVIASDEFVAHAAQTSNGTKMPRADWKVIGKYPVVVPPTSISSNFTQMMRDHLDLADRLMFESRRLAEMRDLLLPKLVTGQVDVSRLDLDGLLEGAVA